MTTTRRRARRQGTGELRIILLYVFTRTHDLQMPYFSRHSIFPCFFSTVLKVAFFPLAASGGGEGGRSGGDGGGRGGGGVGGGGGNGGGDGGGCAVEDGGGGEPGDGLSEKVRVVLVVRVMTQHVALYPVDAQHVAGRPVAARPVAVRLVASSRCATCRGTLRRGTPFCGARFVVVRPSWRPGTGVVAAAPLLACSRGWG